MNNQTQSQRQTHYADYLKLDELLAAQNPLSDHPDELHFIIVHQVHELWFKLALHHMDRARDAMAVDNLEEATRLLYQVSRIFDNARNTAEHLHSLPPVAFNHFRRLLAPGSGMQSYQWRAIELAAGRRDPDFVDWVQRTLQHDQHRREIESRLAEPSLADVFAEVVARHEMVDIASIYIDSDHHPALYALAEALSVLDHRIALWRYAHIQLVERTIGTGTVGTGGTTHDYLQASMQVRLFPDLWAARDVLVRRLDE